MLVVIINRQGVVTRKVKCKRSRGIENKSFQRKGHREPDLSAIRFSASFGLLISVQGLSESAELR